MRAALFAVSLVWGANTVFAQNFYDTEATDAVTLTNGCVYTQNQLSTENEWSLIYTQAGTSVQCPLTIYGLVAETSTPVSAATEQTVSYIPETTIFEEATAAVTRTQSGPDYAPRRRAFFNPRYMVGVFR